MTIAHYLYMKSFHWNFAKHIHTIACHIRFTPIVQSSCKAHTKANFVPSKMTKPRLKVIIDTDPGVDDAVALGMALANNNVDILAITTVRGNLGVDVSTRNALRIAQAFGRSDIPVYKGAAHAILGNEKDVDATFYHGQDGLGNANFDLEPDFSQLESEHAVNAINRLVSENSGEITMITLGPMTNIALACRLNPELGNQLKEVVIMGGNYQGEGNISMAAEYNFFKDPIAARVVFEEFKCPLVLATWELTKEEVLTNEDIEQYIGRDTDRSKFMRKIFKAHQAMLNGIYCLCICDAVAMCVALDRSAVLSSTQVHGTVETSGEHTKGMCIYDWSNQLKKLQNVEVVKSIDVELYREMVLKSTL